MSSTKHFAVQQTFSNEMYDCIQTSSPQRSTPQHLQQRQQDGDTIGSSAPGSSSSPGTYNSQNGNTNNGSNGNTTNTMNGNARDQKPKSTLERFEIDQHSPNYEYDFDDYIEGDNNDSNGHEGRPSNENLLGTAFVTFMGFALIQTVVAYFAKSEAMLGDSAAMIVDALTYLFNYCAERKKAQFNNDSVAATAAAVSLELPSLRHQPQVDRETQQRILERTKRKMVLQLELAPPMISVSTLIVVTIFVLRHSIKVLILDAHRNESLQGNPNIHIMMYFSIANLFLDLINVANFAKAKHLFGYETNDQAPEGHTMLSSNEDDQHNDDNHNDSNNKHSHPRTPQKDDDDNYDDYEEDQDHTANLNMCSAYTVRFCILGELHILFLRCLSYLI